MQSVISARPKRVLRTQADMAGVLRVSTVTVHKALTHQSGVSKELREKVLALASKSGYRIHAGAKAMRRGSFDCIALVQSQFAARSVLPSSLLAGVCATANDNERQLIVATLADEKLTSDIAVPMILRECMSDGLLLNYSAAIPPRIAELLARYAIPTIWLNSKHPADCVYPDDLGAGRGATRELLKLGHRRVVYLDFSSPASSEAIHYSCIDRLQGYSQTMRQAGLAPRRYGDEAIWDQREMIPSLRAMLREPTRPTAAVCYGIREVRGLVHAAALEGLSAPKDFSVIGISDRCEPEFDLRYSVMLLPEAEMGRQGVEMLLKKISDPTTAIPARSVPCTLDLGEMIGSV